MKHSASIDRLRIATPCPAGWEQMSGDGRVRFCDHCQLHVYNISELSRVEAETLIASTEGQICARLFRRADGSVLTKDCPVGLRALRMRMSKRVAAVFAALAGISSAAFGQQASSRQEKTECVSPTKITRIAPASDRAVTSISGTVLDANGAVIPGAGVSIKKDGTEETMNATTTDEGKFQFDSLAAGNYSLKIEKSSFKSLIMPSLVIDKDQLLNIDVILQVDGEFVTVGLLAMDLLLDTSSPAKPFTMSGDQIRRLPLPK